MSDGPLVSVLTPVYNTSAHLGRAIESVLGQLLGDFEYIISDNCSTDGSLEVARRYAERDPRIRVIAHQEFLGQQANYNRALRYVSPASRYVKMVQADDALFADCLSEMVRLAESDPTIGIVGAYELHGRQVKGQGLECADPARPYTVVSGREACRAFLLGRRYLFGTPTSVLYRADIVRARERFFREQGYHEDSEICFELLVDYRFGFVHKILTFSRQDPVSISGRIQDFSPDALHEYIIMRNYGSLHLAADEYRERLNAVEDELYGSLAYNVFRGRDRAFWEYQRRGLELAGMRLDTARLAWMQVPRALWLLGNPASLVRGLWAVARDQVRRRPKHLSREATDKEAV